MHLLTLACVIFHTKDKRRENSHTLLCSHPAISTYSKGILQNVKQAPPHHQKKANFKK